MSDLDRHLQDYLRIRRALGFKLNAPGRMLQQFIAYLDDAHARTITVELAIGWARLPQGVQPISLSHRLGAVRGFARYLQTIDPSTQIPPCQIWPPGVPRPVPYLWSDADVRALLIASRCLTPPLRAATAEVLFGLLAVSGMRIGEALSLSREDVDLHSGVLTIGDAKFGRSRIVPLHPSSTEVLRRYASRRDQLAPQPAATTFLQSASGTAVSYPAVHGTFVKLTTDMGVRTETVRPRIHDLRHSFAVKTLIGWYRSGEDVAAKMPVLSNYLGHVDPAGTYWYLSAAPELMDLAAGRLDSRFEGSR